MINLQQRLDLCIDKSGGPRACWPWRRSVNRKRWGYGRLIVDGRLILAHRLAWTLSRRRNIPKIKRVLHRCDNTRCCNPRHLWLGTVADNNRDRDQKGRHTAMRGQRHPGAKITEQQALSILKDKNLHRVIAAKYGIDRSLVGHIKNKRSWAHIQ